MSTTIEVKNEEVLKVLEAPKFSPFKAVYAGVGLIVTKLSSFVIKKAEDYDAAMGALREAKEIIGKVDEAYEKSAGAEEAHVKKAKDAYKLITNPINLGVSDLKNRMGKFQSDQQRKRDEEEAALRFKAQQEAAKIQEANTSKEAAKIEVKVQKIEAKAEAIAEYKPKTVDKERKFEVVDPDAVERVFCTPEDKKIRPFVGKPGDPIPVIPGVRIWDQVKIVTR